VLDRRVPGSGTALALFTKVVYHYIRNPGIRDRIDEGVRQAITSRPAVVVGHSLGTVVAYSLLNREGTMNNWDVPLFATVGSPLAVTAIRKALQPNQHPQCAKQWFNARDKRDIVALYPLDSEHNWGVDPPIENNSDIENPTSNRHCAVGYLSDREIARRIHQELMK
jgi:pimeloyl-ACP methyl ester carboxylesterase